jgi:hypothetical protein
LLRRFDLCLRILTIFIIKLEPHTTKTRWARVWSSRALGLVETVGDPSARCCLTDPQDCRWRRAECPSKRCLHGKPKEGDLPPLQRQNRNTPWTNER